MELTHKRRRTVPGGSGAAPALAALLLFFAATTTHSQGVQFEEKLSWPKILAKAKTEDKYLFVDAFTTWCGPCRIMRAMLLTQPAAASYFNSKFICVSIQLDTTANDDHHVRSWYKDAHALQQQYNIFAFPTFLIFTPNGKPLHRIVGGRSDMQAFIQSVDESFDTTKQYYTKLREFQDGRRDPDFLLSLSLLAGKVYDQKAQRLVFQTYLDALPNLFSYSPLEYIIQHTHSTNDPGFTVLYQQGPRVDSVLGPGKAEAHVIQVLAGDFVAGHLRSQDEPQWASIRDTLDAHYPDQAEEVVAYGKIMYFEQWKRWPEFQDAVDTYIQRYGEHAIPETLNNYALSVFRYCPDEKCNLEALAWSKRAVDTKAAPFYMQTYAKMLYKMGNKDEALVWIQKAIDVAGLNAKHQYRETLEKMQNNERLVN